MFCFTDVENVYLQINKIFDTSSIFISVTPPPTKLSLIFLGKVFNNFFNISKQFSVIAEVSFSGSITTDLKTHAN